MVVLSTCKWKVLDLNSVQVKKIFKTLILFQPCRPGQIMTFANRVDPDKMAYYEPSHLDPHCLPFCSRFKNVILLAAMDVSKCRGGRVYLRNSGLKGLIHLAHTCPGLNIKWTERHWVTDSSTKCAWVISEARLCITA